MSQNRVLGHPVCILVLYLFHCIPLPGFRFLHLFPPTMFPLLFLLSSFISPIFLTFSNFILHFHTSHILLIFLTFFFLYFFKFSSFKFFHFLFYWYFPISNFLTFPICLIFRLFSNLTFHTFTIQLSLYFQIFPTPSRSVTYYIAPLSSSHSIFLLSFHSLFHLTQQFSILSFTLISFPPLHLPAFLPAVPVHRSFRSEYFRF